MNRLQRLPADEVAAIFGEMRALMAEPGLIRERLERRSYKVSAIGHGFLGLPRTAPADLLLLAPLHEAAPMSVSGLFASGRQVAQCGAIVAAMRAARPSTALLFIRTPLADERELPKVPVVSLEGGVAPRIWPGCFGSVDLLIRCIGRPAQLDSPNTAVNALEGAIPVLAALQAASPVTPGQRRNSGTRDAPLTPRLSVIAAHGGSRGSSPPALFDIVVTRRYAPDETLKGVTAEIEAVIRGAAAPNLRVELSVLGHTSPVEDPTRSRWSREAQALTAGWNWPQTPFRATPPLVPSSVLLGGLADPGIDPARDDASVSVEEIGALGISLRSYLSPP